MQILVFLRIQLINKHDALDGELCFNSRFNFIKFHFFVNFLITFTSVFSSVVFRIAMSLVALMFLLFLLKARMMCLLYKYAAAVSK